MNSKAIAFLLLTIAVTVSAAWFGANWAVRTLERDTVTRISQSFDASGQTWASVEADGLIVQLSGAASNETARFKALELAAQIVDTNRINDETTVATDGVVDIPDFQIEILRNDPELSLIGLVPGKTARLDILKALRETRDDAYFTDLMESIESDAPDGWQDASAFAVSAAVLLPKSRIVATPGRVAIEAFLPSQEELEAMQDRISKKIPKDISVDLDLTAPKSIVAPFRFSAAKSGTTITVSECWSDSADGKTAIEAALDGFGVTTVCYEALGSPSPEWSSAIIAGVAALSNLPEGKLDVNDLDVELIGDGATTIAEFNTVAERLGEGLPEIFSLQPTPPEVQPRTVQATPLDPVFEASRDGSGNLTISGPIRDTPSKVAAERFIAARFGKAQVEGQLVLGANVPIGWSKRVLAGLDALSLMHEGSVVVTNADVSISGTVAKERAQGIIEEILRTQIDGSDYSVDITVDPELETLADQSSVSARECERQLGVTMDAAQIIFDPSSSTISDESEVLLDQIAFIISSCPEARFEIGGHTDSQGSDSMNLSLSQARADAVLDTLLAREVFLDQLTARGYGEEQPIADNDTEEGRTRNRRIAFKLLPNQEVEDE